MEYILSQIFVVLCYLLLGSTYLIKNRSTILIVNMCSLVCNGVSYFLLGAWSGLGVVCIAMLRNAIFIVQQRIKALEKYLIDDIIILIFLMVITVLVGVFTYDTIWSLFSVFASATYTISVWQRNIKVYKILGVLASAFGIVYFVFIHSIFGIILESCMFVTAAVGAIIYMLKHKKEDESIVAELKETEVEENGIS